VCKLQCGLKMRIFAFIPARFASHRFPGKPLALISGRPMIQHVYMRAKACQDFTDVFVATDDARIADCVIQFGGHAVMTEKEHRSGTDRIYEAAVKTGVDEEDIIINIQGDQPLFDLSIVSDLVRPLKEDPSVSISTLKWRIEDQEDVCNPNHVKVVTDKNGYALYFSRAPVPYFRDGDTEKTYYKHLGFYGYRMGFLGLFTRLPEGELEGYERLEQLRALENGYRIKVIETEFNSIEVDVPEDINVAERALLSRSVSRVF